MSFQPVVPRIRKLDCEFSGKKYSQTGRKGEIGKTDKITCNANIKSNPNVHLCQLEAVRYMDIHRVSRSKIKSWSIHSCTFIVW